jgi:hypothetical protein
MIPGDLYRLRIKTKPVAWHVCEFFIRENRKDEGGIDSKWFSLLYPANP